MKRISIIICLAIFATLLSGCNTHFHKYSSPTCSAPAQCECGESKGEPLGHKFADATCTSPQICERCGKYNGKSLGHSYTGILSCTESQVCSRCGKSSSTVLGHDYANATCTTPKTCNRCNATTGTELGHTYSASTCTSPQICLRCEETKGAPLGHNFSDATCEKPQICKRCGNSNGNPLGHRYADNICIRCNQVDPDTLPEGLDELYVIDSCSYQYTKDVFTDTYGYTYSGAHIYLDWWRDLYSIHNLNKDYTTFSGSFVTGSSMSSSSSVTIEIYVDNVLKYKITDYTRETGRIDFEIDVKNAMKLSIKILNIHYTSEVAIVNAELHK